MNLRSSALQGVKWTTLSSVCGVAIHILQISILARLLKPEDFGLMALGMVAIGFAQAFADMGISQAIIHKQQISKNQLSTLYWLNILAAFLCSIILIAASPIIASFYGNPALTSVLILISSVFVLQAIGQQYQILLQKELKFNTIAQIDISSKCIGFIAAIGLAFLDFGVYALVFGALATTLCASTLYVAQGIHTHRPKAVFYLAEVNEFLRFGLYTMGERAINFFSSQLDTLIIGRLIGMEALGIYSVAKTLVLRPVQVINPVITRVSLPLMARIQDDKSKLRNMYLEMMTALSSVNFPLYAAAIVFAPAIVLLLLGEKWHEAIPLIQILSVWAAMRSIGNPTGSLILSQGRYKLGFWWNIFVCVLIIPTILLGNSHGILGIAFSLAGLSIILQVPIWYFLVRPLCEARIWQYMKSIIHPLALASLFALFSSFLNNALYSHVGLKAIESMFISLGLGGFFLLMLYFYFNKVFFSNIVALFKKL